MQCLYNDVSKNVVPVPVSIKTVERQAGSGIAVRKRLLDRMSVSAFSWVIDFVAKDCVRMNRVNYEYEFYILYVFDR